MTEREPAISFNASGEMVVTEQALKHVEDNFHGLKISKGGYDGAVIDASLIEKATAETKEALELDFSNPEQFAAAKKLHKDLGRKILIKYETHRKALGKPVLAFTKFINDLPKRLTGELNQVSDDLGRKIKEHEAALIIAAREAEQKDNSWKQETASKLSFYLKRAKDLEGAVSSVIQAEIDKHKGASEKFHPDMESDVSLAKETCIKALVDMCEMTRQAEQKAAEDEKRRESEQLEKDNELKALREEKERNDKIKAEQEIISKINGMIVKAVGMSSVEITAMMSDVVFPPDSNEANSVKKALIEMASQKETAEKANREEQSRLKAEELDKEEKRIAKEEAEEKAKKEKEKQEAEEASAKKRLEAERAAEEAKRKTEEENKKRIEASLEETLEDMKKHSTFEGLLEAIIDGDVRGLSWNDNKNVIVSREEYDDLLVAKADLRILRQHIDMI